MSYLGPVEQLGTSKGFYKNPNGMKGLEEQGFQQPGPCCVCPQMHFPSLFPAADSRQKGMVSFMMVGRKGGDVLQFTIPQDDSFLFYFWSMRVIKGMGCIGEPVESIRQLCWRMLFSFPFFSFTCSYRTV